MRICICADAKHCFHLIMTRKGCLFRFQSVSHPMASVAEDLGGGDGEVVERDAIALTFAKLGRFRKN
jgi:hypothetical protein